MDVRSPTPFFHFNVLYFPSSCLSFYFSVLLCLARVLSFFVSCLPLLWIPFVCALIFVSCRVCDKECQEGQEFSFSGHLIGLSNSNMSNLSNPNELIVILVILVS